MSQSSTFLSVPKTIFVTMATEIEGELQNLQEYHIHPEIADTHGIMISIEKGLKTGYPLRIHLAPASVVPTEGAMTIATPGDDAFPMEVSLVPPSHIHIFRQIDGRRMNVDIFVPLESSEEFFDIEDFRLTNWTIAYEDDDNEDDDDPENPASDPDQQEAAYYTGVMNRCHVLKLDYTKGATESYAHLPSIQDLQRHFCPHV